jgi:hypothetical protein
MTTTREPWNRDIDSILRGPKRDQLVPIGGRRPLSEDVLRDMLREAWQFGYMSGLVESPKPRVHPTGFIAAPVERAKCVPECNWLQTREHADGCEQ